MFILRRKNYTDSADLGRYLRDAVKSFLIRKKLDVNEDREYEAIYQ